MSRRFVRLSLPALVALAVLFSATAAQRNSAPEARILGLIDVSPAARSEVITAPASVKVGEEFLVTVFTSGGGCERAGEASVVLGENEANVMVYDMTVATRPNVACTMIYKRMPHPATLKFTKPGEAVIRVWGRRVGAETPHFGVPAVVDLKITVR